MNDTDEIVDSNDSNDSNDSPEDRKARKAARAARRAARRQRKLDRMDPCLRALTLLLEHFGNNAAEMARKLDVHYQLVNVWKKTGKVGKQTALRIELFKLAPFTYAELRPDLVKSRPDEKA